MELQVNLLGQLHVCLGEQNKKRTVSCPDGANLSQIVDMLGISRNDLYNAVVNNSPQNLSYIPKSGEEITLIPISVSG